MRISTFRPRPCSAAVWVPLVVILALALVPSSLPAAEEAQPPVYVTLWFDTEDYLLPASDDATLRLARFLSDEGVRATFKVVGEKARVLEQRRRHDVIDALKEHEIGYHTNFHSVHPTISAFSANLGWDDGVAEFNRRQRGGFDDLIRVFGQMPSCYGQPGSSWAPQVYGALREWGVPLYLDAGNHIQLDGRAFWYGGILSVYSMKHTLRTDLEAPSDLGTAKAEFRASYDEIVAAGGGLVSIYYHPCEFVHTQFWDGANFSKGANPPRNQWKLPKKKTAEQTATAFANFEGYVQFIKSLPNVRFVTGWEITNLYEEGRQPISVAQLAASVTPEISYFESGSLSLSPSQIFAGLNEAFVNGYHQGASLAESKAYGPSLVGPTSAPPVIDQDIDIDLEQFARTAKDVDAYLDRHQRIPNAVWFGSQRVSPERYLYRLARLLEQDKLPQTVTFDADVKVRLAAADYVQQDNPRLWGWVIFPDGFSAPEMMRLAKRQAWTLKPALLGSRGLQSPIEFQPAENWPRIPSGLQIGQTSGVSVDSKGRVYVFHRGERPILCFDADGQLLRYWGDDLVGKAHGLRIDRHDNVWTTDVGRHVVRKFNPEGELLLTLGTDDEPGLDENHFDQPADVAFGPNGEIFVADGYGNSRVVKFTADGKFIKAWGTPGNGPGEFNLPHTVVVDSTNRVIVGDRENDRIQVFDLDGKLQKIWNGFAPFGLALAENDHLFVADGRAHTVLHLDRQGKVMQSWGAQGTAPGQFDLPHMLATDDAGNLYVAEITGQRVQKLIRKR